jgi:hypothetical protein
MTQYYFRSYIAHEYLKNLREHKSLTLFPMIKGKKTEWKENIIGNLRT